MSLELASWLDKAQALSEGQRKRVAHDCGSGTTMIVEHKREGWGAYCWRCNDKGWHFKPELSLAERIKRWKEEEAAEATVSADLRPPSPTNFDPSTWPLEARVWLYKAGLNNDVIRSWGIYHHAPTNRVVIPIFDGDKLVFWQARGFNPDRPKYLNPEAADKPAFKAGHGPTLVLTEDILSAIRVGEVTEAWCLMGTSITDKMLSAIMEAGKPVKVWLDPDGAGIKARRKFVPKLRAYGVDATSIQTDKDPKYYSREEIAAVIGFDTAAPA